MLLTVVQRTAKRDQFTQMGTTLCGKRNFLWKKYLSDRQNLLRLIRMDRLYDSRRDLLKALTQRGQFGTDQPTDEHAL